MAVGFHNVGYSSDPCLICWCPMDDVEDINIKGGIIAHDGNGDTHPWHSTCIKEALKVNEFCPCCRIPLDVSVLFTWKERIIREIKHVYKDAREDLFEGSFLGLTGGFTVAALAFKAGFIFHALMTDFNNNKSKHEFAIQRKPLLELSGKIFLVIFVGVTIGLVGAKVMNRFLARRGMPHLEDWVVCTDF